MSDTTNIHKLSVAGSELKLDYDVEESGVDISHSKLLSLLANSNIIRLLNIFRNLNDEEMTAYIDENITKWVEKYQAKKKEKIEEQIELEERERKEAEDEKEDDEIKETTAEEVIYENIGKLKAMKISENTSSADICKIYKIRFPQILENDNSVQTVTQTLLAFNSDSRNDEMDEQKIVCKIKSEKKLLSDDTLNEMIAEEIQLTTSANVLQSIQKNVNIPIFNNPFLYK